MAAFGVQTFTTPPTYADAVAQWLASAGPAPILPGRLCTVTPVAVSWRLVQRSDTKDDRVELVAFHMDRACRRRTRTLAEIRYFQHVGDTCDPILVRGDGYEKKRRSPTILADMSAGANACKELRELRHHFGMKSIRDFFFAPGVAAVVARGLVDRCSWNQLVRRNAPRNTPLHCKPTTSSIHSIISALAPDLTPRVIDVVTWSQRCLQSKAKTPGRSFAS